VYNTIIAILQIYDPSTEFLYAHFCRTAQGAQEGLEEDGVVTSATGQARIWRSARR